MLVLDDDEDNLLILEEALRSWGFDVRSAGSCAEARASLHDASFDLLVTDMKLQDGNAIDLVASLGAARPRGAVLVTGFGQPEDRAASEAAGFQAHLVKPVSIEQLEETLRSVLAATGDDATSSRASPAPPSPR